MEQGERRKGNGQGRYLRVKDQRALALDEIQRRRLAACGANLSVVHELPSGRRRLEPGARQRRQGLGERGMTRGRAREVGQARGVAQLAPAAPGTRAVPHEGGAPGRRPPGRGRRRPRDHRTPSVAPGRVVEQPRARLGRRRPRHAGFLAFDLVLTVLASACGQLLSPGTVALHHDNGLTVHGHSIELSV